MNTPDQLVSEAISDFGNVAAFAALANAQCLDESIRVEIAGRPHKAPGTLPTGKMAVYAFFLSGKRLRWAKSDLRAQRDIRRNTTIRRAPEAHSCNQF